jgi:N-acyl-D-amino-acid deacylase
VRSESDAFEEAIAELIDIGRRSGARVHISHFKAAGRHNWPKIDRVLDMVREARSQGIRLTADQYPYVAGSTMLGAVLPPWAHAGGVDETLARLRSPGERTRLRAAILGQGPSKWDNFWTWSGGEGIVISDIPSGSHPEYIGKNVAQAASLRARAADGVSQETAVEFVLDLLAEECMGVGIISFSQSEDVVRKIMCEPYVNVCTDGLLGGRPHPRAYGTYPRILGRYVREQGLLSLEEAVHKMTDLAAQAFQLEGYGRIAVDARANLVVFDEQLVADQATFDEPRQYPRGIEYVIVEGVVSIQKDVQRESGSGIGVRS